jgi:hypothetical protein
MVTAKPREKGVAIRGGYVEKIRDLTGISKNLTNVGNED